MHVHDLKAIDKCLRHLMLGSKILKCIISMQHLKVIIYKKRKEKSNDPLHSHCIIIVDTMQT